MVQPILKTQPEYYLEINFYSFGYLLWVVLSPIELCLQSPSGVQLFNLENPPLYDNHVPMLCYCDKDKVILWAFYNWGPLPKLRQEYLQTQLKRSHKSTKGILYISLGRTKITCIPCIGRKSLLYYKERGKFKKPTLILVCINFCSNVFYRMYIKSTINYS